MLMIEQTLWAHALRDLLHHSPRTFGKDTSLVVGWLSLIAVVVLVLLLVEKQRLAGASGDRARALNRALNIAILPLLVAFAFNLLVAVAASVSQGR
jgi:hypothetical protein